MTETQAKTAYYTQNGFTLTGVAYAMKLAERDDMEVWSKRLAGFLSAKIPPKTIKKQLIVRLPSILLP